MNLTVLVPGIRTKNWEKLYNSIYEAFSGSWEMIFISPYDLPEELKSKPNVLLIKDWGTPIRCQQIGLTKASGDFITWAADDGYFLKGSLDLAFEKLKGEDYKTLVMGKYIEGENNGDMPMQSTEYYYLDRHDASKVPFMPKDCLMLNVGVVSKKLLYQVGGWDCQFEVCPMAYNDLAVRLHYFGTKFIVQDEIMFHCSHMPGTLGDHGPVHYAQIKHDEPLFRRIYSDISYKTRIVIDLANWMNSPAKWIRRFGYV